MSSNLSSLGDRALLDSTRNVLRQGRLVDADLLLHLGEVEARKLYLLEAASSVFKYCSRSAASIP